MTLIVGIRCQDGIVLGADGAATFGAMGQSTIRQETRKLDILEGCIITGVSGPIGLGQLIRGEVETLWKRKGLSDKKPHEAMAMLREALLKHVLPELQVAQIARNVIGQAGITGAICATMIAVPVDKSACLFQFDQNCSPEEASATLPFQAVGSGQAIADPFLAFIRRIFWPDHLPTLGEGIFAALWTLKHAIKTAPGGISDPTQLAVLTKGKSGYQARELPSEELQEHEDAIQEAEASLANFRNTFQPTSQGASQPPPAPPKMS